MLQRLQNHGTSSQKGTSSGSSKSGAASMVPLPPVVPKKNANPQTSVDTSNQKQSRKKVKNGMSSSNSGIRLLPTLPKASAKKSNRK